MAFQCSSTDCFKASTLGWQMGQALDSTCHHTEKSKGFTSGLYGSHLDWSQKGMLAIHPAPAGAGWGCQPGMSASPRAGTSPSRCPCSHWLSTCSQPGTRSRGTSRRWRPQIPGSGRWRDALWWSKCVRTRQSRRQSWCNSHSCSCTLGQLSASSHHWRWGRGRPACAWHHWEESGSDGDAWPWSGLSSAASPSSLGSLRQPSWQSSWMWPQWHPCPLHDCARTSMGPPWRHPWRPLHQGQACLHSQPSSPGSGTCLHCTQSCCWLPTAWRSPLALCQHRGGHRWQCGCHAPLAFSWNVLVWLHSNFVWR